MTALPLLLFCSLLGCLLYCLFRRLLGWGFLLGGSLLFFLLSCPLSTSFCGFADALRRGLLGCGLSAFGASCFGRLLCGLLGRSFLGCLLSRSLRTSLLGWSFLGRRLFGGGSFCSFLCRT